MFLQEEGLVYNNTTVNELWIFKPSYEALTNQSKTSVNDLPAHLVHYITMPTRLRLNGLYVELFCGWINFLVHILLPYVTMIVLNSLILIRLENFLSESSDRQRRKDVKLAKISFLIVLVFMICHSFRWIPNVYELYLVSRGQLSFQICQSNMSDGHSPVNKTQFKF